MPRASSRMCNPHGSVLFPSPLKRSVPLSAALKGKRGRKLWIGEPHSAFCWPSLGKHPKLLSKYYNNTFFDLLCLLLTLPTDQTDWTWKGSDPPKQMKKQKPLFFWFLSRPTLRGAGLNVEFNFRGGLRSESTPSSLRNNSWHDERWEEEIMQASRRKKEDGRFHDHLFIPLSAP